MDDSTKPDNNTTGLTAQQLRNLEQRAAAEILKVIKDTELRLTAVSEAVKVLETCKHMTSTKHPDVVALARELHAFLAEGAAEVKVTIA
jgi:hypothetical protein